MSLFKKLLGVFILIGILCGFILSKTPVAASLAYMHMMFPVSGILGGLLFTPLVKLKSKMTLLNWFILGFSFAVTIHLSTVAFTLL